jgi:peptidoglycan/LPS O-acetylase OafA/YrhL
VGGPVETEVVPTPVTPGEPQVVARVERFPCFDGLRALAALSVFAFHSARVLAREDSTFVPLGVQPWLDQLGRLGVAIFFVISGFLLFRPYALAMLEGRPAPRLGPFWKRRFFRIFPAYWVALAVVVFVVGQSALDSIGEGIAAFALVHTYRYGDFALGLGVAWTLVVEVSFYVVLPLFAAGVRKVIGTAGDVRRSMRIQLGALVLVGALGLLVRQWYFLGTPIGHPALGDWFAPDALILWLPGYLDWFAFGMAMALGSAWLAVGGRVPRLVAALGRTPGWSWLLAVGCYWVVVQGGIGVRAPLSQISAEQQALAFAFVGLSAAMFVLPAAFGPQHTGSVRSLLRARPLVALGVVSYGFYLWHLPAWIQAEDWGVDALPMAVQVALVLVVAVAIAAASWFAVERPLIRWSTGTRSTRRTAIVPARHQVAGSVPETDRPDGPGRGRLAVASVVVLVALVGLVVGSLDLDPPPGVGAKDAFAFTGRSGQVRDDFDRVDPTGLGTASTGQRWEELSGTWSVANGEASVDPGGGLAVIRIGAHHARTVGGGLAFRVANVRNYWSVEPVPHFHTWNVERVVDGQKSFVKNLGNGALRPASAIAVHLDGSRIEIAVDGTVRLTLDDPILRGATGVGLVRTPGRATTPWTSFAASR